MEAGPPWIRARGRPGRVQGGLGEDGEPRRSLEFEARGPVLRLASHRANPRRGLSGPAVVTHFDNRINEVHITYLSTNSSCYWRVVRVRPPPGPGAGPPWFCCRRT